MHMQISYDWSWFLSVGENGCCFTHFPSAEASPQLISLRLFFACFCFCRKYCVLLTCSLPQCPVICSSSNRRDLSLASRSSVQGSTVCVCPEDGNDYHKRWRKDYVRNSLQSCTFSKASCFALQNHIMFCSSFVAVWCWSWICERLRSKSAVFTNTEGMSARDGQIQIWSLWSSKWLVIWPINKKHGFWLCKVFPALRALNSITKSNHSSALQMLASWPLSDARVSA